MILSATTVSALMSSLELMSSLSLHIVIKNNVEMNITSNTNASAIGQPFTLNFAIIVVFFDLIFNCFLEVKETSCNFPPHNIVL